jgi:predicted Fe-Mo cluster-binding NifX family protein
MALNNGTRGNDMKLFKREATDMADNGKPQTRSRLQSVLDDIMTAQQACANAANRFSSMGFDMQKFADSLLKTHESFVKAIEQAGGEVERESIEEQIKEFIPKTLHRDTARHEE